MMLMRVIAAFALLVPGAALAQARAAQPVTVEVIAIGEIDAPATYLTMSASWSVEGTNQAAADKAKLAKLAEVLKVLADAGVPNSAITELPADDPLRITTAPKDLLGIEETADAATADAATKPAEPSWTAGDGKSIRVTSMAQAAAVRTALDRISVTLSQPEAHLDDQAAVYRQAKVLALRNARLDGDAYAREMGMRVLRVSKISETGNNIMLPGFQEKMQRLMGAGPDGMKELFKSRPGTVHVEAAVVVEFVVAL
ncbi:MAG: SIMPL domain-containing protein [Sphingomonadales bacterium]|nr:MAG: SIMPL domain-containing protein [Sphingomonadales bacterium]